MPTVLNSPALREEAWENIKSAYRDIASTRVGKGLKKIGRAGGIGVYMLFRGGMSYLGYDILTNPNSKPYQKIFPAIGVAVGIVTLVPATIIGLIGVSVLVPPFSIVASVAGVVRNVAIYYKDRVERNNLRKLLVTEDDLEKLLKKSNLSESEKITAFNFATKQQDLYSALYSLRQAVIEINDKSMSFEDKRNLVFQINRTIESVALGENKLLMLTLPENTPDEIHDKMQIAVGIANDQILQYREITKKYQQINMPPKLGKAIDRFKDMRGKIYAQDLPDRLKHDIVEMLDKKKNKKAKIQEIFLRLGNHYLNVTSAAQASMIARGKHVTPETQVAVMSDYPTPELPFVYKNYNQIRKAKKAIAKSKFVGRTNVKFKSGVRRAKRAAIRKLFGAEGLARRDEKRANSKLLKQERKVIETDFTERYKATFDAFAKNERLAYLEKSTDRRLAEIGFGVATACVSIAATVMVASAASPAAPLAVAGVAVGAVATTMTAASIAAAAELAYKENNAESRVASPANKVTKAVVPELSVKRPEPVISQWELGRHQTQEPAVREALGQHRATNPEPSADKDRNSHRP